MPYNTRDKLKKIRFKHLKGILIPCCLLGFLYKTLGYMVFYWTYPVVVDIQTTSPLEITLPAISFCNTNGIKPAAFCSFGAFCFPPFLSLYLNPCKINWMLCKSMNYTVAKDYHGIAYHDLVQRKHFTPPMMERLKKPVDDFFKCKIVSGDQERNCNMDDMLIGSYYSESNIFSICYTINSLWSQPNKTLEKVKMSDRIQIEFFIDTSDRDIIDDMDLVRSPKHNYPVYNEIQMSFHNNYAALSPYKNGVGVNGGKKYQIKLKQEERHLLPSPYQTNCTDYMSSWRARGGLGPLNQIMVIEECKYNLSLEHLGCVPFNVDYPHNVTICGDHTNRTVRSQIAEQCTMLLESYNQPCHFVSYETKLIEKLIFLEKKLINTTTNISETLYVSQRGGYDCTHGKLWTQRCQTLNIEVVFDEFDITTTSYNPKIESLELFSVIGGYMGIFLGVSIVAVYDFLHIVTTVAHRFWNKRNKVQRFQEKAGKSRHLGENNHRDIRRRFRVRPFNEVLYT